MVNYDPVEFTKIKVILEKSPAVIEAAENEIQAAKDGQVEWTQIAFYEKVIYADMVTNLPLVTPTSIYVLRADEAK